MGLRSRLPRRRRRRLHRTRLALTLARLRRSTLFALAAATATATLTGSATAGLLRDAAEARATWGTVTTVEVVVRAIAAGEVISPSAVRRLERPASFVPEDALRWGAAGRVALAPLVPGDVVVAARVGDDLVPPGWRAVAVPPPAASAHPDVLPGDIVDVIDVSTPDADVVRGTAVAVRPEDGAITVAVPAAEAPGLAYAAASGTAVLALIAAPRRL